MTNNWILLFFIHFANLWGFPGGSGVKNLPAMQDTQETWIWSLGQEDPRRRKWQPTPVFLPGVWTEEPGGLQSMRVQRVGHNWETDNFTFIGIWGLKFTIVFFCLYFSIFLFLPFCGLLELFLEFHLICLCYLSMLCLKKNSYLFYSFLVVVPGTTLYILNLSHITDSYMYWELILVSQCWHSPVCGKCRNIPTFYNALSFPIYIITVYKISSTYILGHGAIFFNRQTYFRKFKRKKCVYSPTHTFTLSILLSLFSTSYWPETEQYILTHLSLPELYWLEMFQYPLTEQRAGHRR